MKNRRRAVVACCIVALGISGGAALAQPAPPAGGGASGGVPIMPSAAFTAPGANRAAIVKFVTDNVGLLLNDKDAAAQSQGRRALEGATVFAPAGGGPPQPATPPFMFEYGKALNDEFTARLKAGKLSVRQRLNIGIVTARVAAAAQNALLEGTAVALLNDPDEPVVLWGMKAAKEIIPSVMKQRPNKQQVPRLVAAVTPVALKHPSGVIMEEAYDALGQVPEDVTIAELLKLWEARLAMYAKGVPNDPIAEAKPVYWLTSNALWQGLLANQKARQDEVVQKLANQLSLAAQHADQPPATPADARDQLLGLAKQCAGGCLVLGRNQNKPALVTASQPLVNASASQPGMKVSPLATALVTEIRNAFPAVKAPPTVQGAAGMARP